MAINYALRAALILHTIRRDFQKHTPAGTSDLGRSGMSSALIAMKRNLYRSHVIYCVDCNEPNALHSMSSARSAGITFTARAEGGGRAAHAPRVPGRILVRTSAAEYELGLRVRLPMEASTPGVARAGSPRDYDGAPSITCAQLAQKLHQLGGGSLVVRRFESSLWRGIFRICPSL